MRSFKQTCAAVSLFALTTAATLFALAPQVQASNTSSAMYPRATMVNDSWNAIPPVAITSSIASQNFDSKPMKYTSVVVPNWPAFPYLSIPANLDRIAVMDLAKPFVAARVAGYASAVKAKLAQVRTSIAIIDVTQQFSINGSRKRLSFPITVYSNGKYVYGAPQVHDGDVVVNSDGTGTKILEAIYLPGRPVGSIPAGWRFDPLDAVTPIKDIGASAPANSVIRYRVKLLATSEILTGWTVVDLGTSTYDSGFSTDGTRVETTLGVNCLLNQAYVSPLSGARCPDRTGQSFVDLRKVMGETDAKYGFFNYIDSMKPAYVPSAVTPGTSNAGLKVDVTDRNLYYRCNQATGGIEADSVNPNYTEAGTYTYVIDRKVTRYMVNQLRGQVWELAQAQDALPIPAQSYVANATLTTQQMLQVRTNAVFITHMSSWRAVARFPEGQPTYRPVNVIIAPCTAPPAVVDVCSNIAGVQEFVPVGYRANRDGTCTLIAPPPVGTDLCDNIDGIQLTIPFGYEANLDGSCTPIPPPTGADLCSNINDVQLTVPDGYQRNADGTCTPIGVPPVVVDLCNNIDGIQETVPVGYQRFTDGSCRLIPPSSQPGRIVVSKLFVGDASALSQPYPEITVFANCTASGVRSVSFQPPSTGTITDLQVGERCVMSEVPVSGSALAQGYAWQTPQWLPAVSVDVALVTGVTVRNPFSHTTPPLCRNLPGDFTQIPLGYYGTSDGKCYTATSRRFCTCGNADVNGFATSAETFADAGLELSNYTGLVAVVCHQRSQINNTGASGVYRFINGTINNFAPYPNPPNRTDLCYSE